MSKSINYCFFSFNSYSYATLELAFTWIQRNTNTHEEIGRVSHSGVERITSAALDDNSLILLKVYNAGIGLRVPDR